MTDISDTELIDWMRDILPTIDEYGTMVRSDLDRLIALARIGAAVQPSSLSPAAKVDEVKS